ncbi:hypothetical protein, partial [Actinotignum timonense]
NIANYLTATEIFHRAPTSLSTTGTAPLETMKKRERTQFFLAIHCGKYAVEFLEKRRGMQI